MNTVTVTFTLPYAEAQKLIAYAESLTDEQQATRETIIETGELHTRSTHHPEYARDHDRLHKARGSATEHTCACGRPAEQWAYLNTGISETMCGECGKVSSADPSSYRPMCVSCHRSFDMAAASRGGGWRKSALDILSKNPNSAYQTSELCMELDLIGVSVARQTLATYLSAMARHGVVDVLSRGPGRRYMAASNS